MTFSALSAPHGELPPLITRLVAAFFLTGHTGGIPRSSSPVGTQEPAVLRIMVIIEAQRHCCGFYRLYCAQL